MSWLTAGGHGALPLAPRPLPPARPRGDLALVRDPSRPDAGVDVVGVAIVVATSPARRGRHAACFEDFKRQTWPALEAVVVDVGASAPSPAWAAAAAGGARVRYETVAAPLSDGAARNRGAARTAAPVVAFWDDRDDQGGETARSTRLQRARIWAVEIRVRELDERNEASKNQPRSSRVLNFGRDAPNRWSVSAQATTTRTTTSSAWSPRSSWTATATAPGRWPATTARSRSRTSASASTTAWNSNLRPDFDARNLDASTRFLVFFVENTIRGARAKRKRFV